MGYVKLCYFATRFSKRIQYFNRDRINIYFLSVNYICSVNLLNKRVKIPARDSLYGLLCKKILLDVVAHFLCFPNLQVKVDHADNQIFHWNPKATSIALLARVCFLSSVHRVWKAFIICRVIFKSQVMPLLGSCFYSTSRRHENKDWSKS